jgi:type I restriction enzyme S subunit
MKADTYTATGIPVVRGNNLTGRPGFSGDFVFVSEATAARFARCLVRPGDLVFPHRGAIGEVGLVVEQGFERWMLSTSMMKLRPDPQRLDSRFAFYFFRSSLGRHQLLKNASQVGTPGIGQPLASLRACELALPPLRDQQAIAGVLGVLDDKIEQNRRTARALQRLARAIFRAWFVDFEPVKAKAAGATAFPSMPQPVFDALPTRFVDSDIGPVPEGWEVKALFHQGVTNYGFRFPTHLIYCTVDARLAEPRDVLLSVRAPVGRINVADRRLVLGRGLAGLRHRQECQSFLLYQLSHMFAEEDAVGDGTIYKAVTKKFLSQMPTLSPRGTIVEAFDAMVSPFDDLVAASETESRKLCEMRDYLLPKLLSGQVRVEVSNG